MQIFLLNLGLRDYDQLLVVPVFAVSLEFFTILGGLLFFGEFGTLNTVRKILFALGVIVTFLGVFVITLGQKMKRDAQETKLLDVSKDVENSVSDLVEPLIG